MNVLKIDILKFLHLVWSVVVNFVIWVWSRFHVIYPKHSLWELDGDINWSELPKGQAWESRIKWLKKERLVIVAKRGYGAYIDEAACRGHLQTLFRISWQSLEEAIDNLKQKRENKHANHTQET